MSQVLKQSSILLLGLVFLLAGSFAGCGGINSEAYSYLSEMQKWQDKWNEKWSGGNLDELDDLVDELETIEVPRDPIPLTFDGQTLDYWTFDSHEQYIFAHRNWISIQAHMNRMQELEEERYRDMGSDEIPSCSVAMEYGEGSPEYKDTCWLVEQARGHLGYVEGRLLYWLVLYLPEQYEEK
jgi:hypothetical protein